MCRSRVHLRCSDHKWTAVNIGVKHTEDALTDFRASQTHIVYQHIRLMHSQCAYGMKNCQIPYDLVDLSLINKCF